MAAPAPASFTLSLGALNSDAIQALELGQPIDELQRLSVQPLVSMSQLKSAATAGSLSYSLTLGSLNTKLNFVLPSSTTAAALAAAMATNAAALQAGLERMLGQGAASVSYDAKGQAGWHFDIHYQGGRAGKNIGALVVKALGAADGLLLLSAQTVTQGSAGATAKDQAALVQAGLDQMLGAGSATVVVDPDGRYRITFGGSYDGQNLAQLHSTLNDASVTLGATTLVPGVAATGPSYLFDPAALIGASSFNVEVTVNGLAYSAEGLALDATQAVLTQKIDGAISAISAPVNEHQRLTLKDQTGASGSHYTVLTPDGRSADLVFSLGSGSPLSYAQDHATALQAALTGVLGAGNVAVRFDSASLAQGSSTGWVFDIRYQGGLKALNLLDLSFKPVTASGVTSKLTLTRSTVQDGAEGSLKQLRLRDLGLTVSVTPATGAEGGAGWVVSLGGDLVGNQVDGLRVQAVAAPAAPESPASPLAGEAAAAVSRPMAVGGVVVRNDVRGVARAYIERATVEAGSLSVNANDNAVIQAKVDSTATAKGGEGPGLAVGGVIATNLVLSSANASISLSDISTTNGDVNVEGTNSAHIVARNQSAMSSDGLAIGVTLAFNTVGYQAQNVLFAAIDALVGTNLGDAQPAAMRATVTDSDIRAAGSVTVKADNQAYINAYLSNDTSSEASAATGNDADETSGQGTAGTAGTAGGAGKTAAPKPKGLALGFVLASNMVSSLADAHISGAGRNVSTEAGSLTVAASDDARITSKTSLSAVAKGEESEASLALKALVNYVGISYTDRSGERKLKIGDRVRVADVNFDTADDDRRHGVS